MLFQDEIPRTSLQLSKYRKQHQLRVYLALVIFHPIVLLAYFKQLVLLRHVLNNPLTGTELLQHPQSGNAINRLELGFDGFIGDLHMLLLVPYILLPFGLTGGLVLIHMCIRMFLFKMSCMFL